LRIFTDPLIYYFFSSRDGVKTLNESSVFTDFIVRILYRSGYSRQQYMFWQTLARQCGHIALYLSLGVSAGLWVNYFSLRHSKWKSVIISLIICASIAFTDEWLKQYVPGRHYQLSDVCLNIVSSVCGLALCVLLFYILARRKQRKKKYSG